MHKLGLPVPPGFVVADSVFQEFLDRNHLRQPIAALRGHLDLTDVAGVRRAAHAIRKWMLDAPLDEAMRGEIAALRQEIVPGATVIVRSSAVGEDSARASYAGQLESVPDVHSTEALEPSLRLCWASFWSERSLSYQLSHGIELVGMGVVVQEQIQARISGVLFTRSPDRTVAGDDYMLAEYCFGPGGPLVSGRINPGRFTVARRDFRWWVVAAPEQPDVGEANGLLNDARMSALARAGLALEDEFSGPQDIEWVIARDGRLFLVQSRPITGGNE